MSAPTRSRTEANLLYLVIDLGERPALNDFAHQTNILRTLVSYCQDIVRDGAYSPDVFDLYRIWEPGAPRDRSAEISVEAAYLDDYIRERVVPDASVARRMVAEIVGKSGNALGALRRYRELAELEAYSSLDPVIVRLSVTRSGLAYWTAIAVDPAAAVPIYRDLLEHQAGHLHSSDPRVVATRVSLIQLLRATGLPSHLIIDREGPIEDLDAYAVDLASRILTYRDNSSEEYPRSLVRWAGRQFLPDNGGPTWPMRVVRTRMSSPWVTVLGDLAREATPIGYIAVGVVVFKQLFSMLMDWQVHRQDMAERQASASSDSRGELVDLFRDLLRQLGIASTQNSPSAEDPVIRAAEELGRILEVEMIDEDDPRLDES
ncbi:hypothetical protein [Actinokineospora cianjurensis]|uniref:Uncharacterized protein n=1 Tax=Actinokineospora cianjurensis TaxID=585224 RepID=A0A421AXB8_9PSEU|nr:hypothetical protein [Actinokineospora cianjurensis]RLK54438.1 hypothetical protein CLV68_5989 [Actinokineospora cianjurensis]